MDQKVLINLFKLNAMSFCGVEIWFMKLHTKDLNNIAIAYHKAIKRMCNKRPYDSNHECLERVNLPIFKHLVAKKLINFAFSLFQSNSPCLSSHKYYFRAYSNYGKEIKKLFYEKYQIPDVFDNPLCAVIARIEFIQRTEPRSIGFDPG